MSAILAAPPTEALPGLFARSFSVVRADSRRLRDALFRLRYQVYCVENQFENAADFPECRETDAWDEAAYHAALIHKPSGWMIGGVRLIPAGTDSLPIRRVIGPEETRTLDVFPQHRTAEISRYSISRMFRRRLGENDYPDALIDWTAHNGHGRILPGITVGLMRAVLGFCAERDIQYLFAVMAPALLRLLDRFGLHFERLGPCVQHHGLRQPCYAAYSDLLAGLRARCADYYDLVQSAFDHEPPAGTSGSAAATPVTIKKGEALRPRL